MQLKSVSTDPLVTLEIRVEETSTFAEVIWGKSSEDTDLKITQHYAAGVDV